MSNAPTQPRASVSAWLILGMLLAGMLAGGAAASAFWWSILQRERTNQEAVHVANKLIGLGNNVAILKDGARPHFGGNPAAGKPGETEESVALEQGKEWIADLEKDRVIKLYNSMTPELQKKQTRDVFEKTVHEAVPLTQLSNNTGTRDYKIRKSADGKKYEFYFTGQELFVPQRMVNVSIMMEKAGDAWLLGDIEIQVQKKS